MKPSNNNNSWSSAPCWSSLFLSLPLSSSFSFPFLFVQSISFVFGLASFSYHIFMQTSKFKLASDGAWLPSFKQREMRFNFEFGCMHMWQCMCWVHVRYPRHTWTAMFIRELMQEGGRAPTRAQRREGKGTGLGRGREKKDRDRLALQLAAAIRPQYILGKVAAAGGSE